MSHFNSNPFASSDDGSVNLEGSRVLTMKLGFGSGSGTDSSEVNDLDEPFIINLPAIVRTTKQLLCSLVHIEFRIFACRR